MFYILLDFLDSVLIPSNSVMILHLALFIVVLNLYALFVSILFPYLFYVKRFGFRSCWNV